MIVNNSGVSGWPVEISGLINNFLSIRDHQSFLRACKRTHCYGRCNRGNTPDSGILYIQEILVIYLVRETVLAYVNTKAKVPGYKFIQEDENHLKKIFEMAFANQEYHDQAFAPYLYEFKYITQI
jgi:hypothetical protein